MEASPSFDPRRLRIGALLLRGGLLDAEQLAEALDEKEATGERLGQIVLRRGWVTEEALARTLAEQSGLEFVDLDTFTRESRAELLLSGKLARYFRCVPLAVLDEQTILVAVADPTSPLLGDIPSAIGYEIRVAIATETAIDRALLALDPDGAPEPALLDPPAEPALEIAALGTFGEPLLRVVPVASEEEPEPAQTDAGAEAPPTSDGNREEPLDVPEAAPPVSVAPGPGEPARAETAAPEPVKRSWLAWRRSVAETPATPVDTTEAQPLDTTQTQPADPTEPESVEPRAGSSDLSPDLAASEPQTTPPELPKQETEQPWPAWQPAVEHAFPEASDATEAAGAAEPVPGFAPAGDPEPPALSWLAPIDEPSPAAELDGHDDHVAEEAEILDGPFDPRPAEPAPEPSGEPDPVVVAAQDMIATLTGSNRQQLGMMLLQRGLLTPGQLVEVLLEQEETGIRLGTVIAGRGWISQTELARVLAEQHELDYFDLGAEPLAPGAAHLLPEWAARAYRAVPVRLRDDGSLLVAVADPTDLPDLTSQAGRPVRFAVSAASDVERAIERLYASPPADPEADPGQLADPEAPVAAETVEAAEPKIEETFGEMTEEGGEQASAAPVTAEGEPALEPQTDGPDAAAAPPAPETFPPADPAQASAPEPEPAEGWPVSGYEVADGPKPPADPTLAAALGAPLHPPEPSPWPAGPSAASEPGDGFDARPDRVSASEPLGEPEGVAVELAAVGEAGAPGLVDVPPAPLDALPESVETPPEPVELVAEPLDVSPEPTERPADLSPALAADAADAGLASPLARLEELGLGPEQITALKSAVEQPLGLVLAIGPSGSGRTTTLRTATELLADPSRDLIEIESKALGGKALRTAVQAEPSLLLIADLEHAGTARAAVEAALRGHLVLSTLHAPSPGSALARLTAMGIDRQVLAATLTCVLGQRLARRLCPACREPYEAGRSSLIAAGFGDTYLPATPHVRVYGARGCGACDGGYGGRVGLFEVLTVSAPIRRVLESGSASDVDGAAAYGGTRTLRADGLRHCMAGRTTLDEVRRVVGSR